MHRKLLLISKILYMHFSNNSGIYAVVYLMIAKSVRLPEDVY
jgi:hypothetical protein